MSFQSKTILFFKKNSKVITSSALFLAILFVYLVVNTSWFFIGEEYSILLRAKQTKNLTESLLFFKNGNIQPTCSFNIRCAIETFASPSVYYRPLLLFFTWIEFLIFGYSAYLYFFLSILLHAFAAVILFLLISLFATTWLALLCSCFFAFHPILIDWFGQIGCQQHQINLFFIIATLFFLKRFLSAQKNIYYIISCILFFCSLLTRETYIVLPFLLIIILQLFPQLHDSKVLPLKKQLFLTMGFFVPIVLFLGLRFYAYPPNNLSLFFESWHYSTSSLCNGLISVVGRLVNLVYDMFWRMWYPWNTYNYCKEHNLVLVLKYIKGMIICIVFLLYIFNTEKKKFIALTCMVLILHWPLIASGRCCPRLQYDALPVISIGLAHLIYYSSLFRYKFFSKIIFLFFGIFIITNAYIVLMSQRNIMKSAKKITSTLIDFSVEATKTPPNSHLLIFNLPEPKAIHLKAIIFYDPFYESRKYSLTDEEAAQITIHGQCQDIKHFLRTQKNNDLLTIFTTNKEKIWFTQTNSTYNSVYNKLTTQDNKLSEISIPLKKIHYPLVLGVWNYEQEKIVLAMA